MRISLDVDGPLALFQEHLLDYYDLDRTPPVVWDDPRFVEYVPKSYLIEDFWLTIPRRFDPKILNFIPVAYITARGVPSELTERWLSMNGFPEAKVITVGHAKSKVEAIKEVNATIHLDDSFMHYCDILMHSLETGTRPILFTQSHNEKATNVKRVDTIEEFMERYVNPYVCT